MLRYENQNEPILNIGIKMIFKSMDHIDLCCIVILPLTFNYVSPSTLKMFKFYLFLILGSHTLKGIF